MKNKHNKTFLGTPEFMAPEVYEEHYDTSADIYAFGMTLLEMVTNSTPYEECVNFMQMYTKIMNKQLPDAVMKIKD